MAVAPPPSPPAFLESLSSDRGLSESGSSTDSALCGMDFTADAEFSLSLGSSLSSGDIIASVQLLVARIGGADAALIGMLSMLAVNNTGSILAAFQLTIRIVDALTSGDVVGGAA